MDCVMVTGVCCNGRYYKKIQHLIPDSIPSKFGDCKISVYKMKNDTWDYPIYIIGLRCINIESMPVRPLSNNNNIKRNEDICNKGLLVLMKEIENIEEEDIKVETWWGMMEPIFPEKLK